MDGLWLALDILLGLCVLSAFTDDLWHWHKC